MVESVTATHFLHSRMLDEAFGSNQYSRYSGQKSGVVLFAVMSV